MKPKILLLLIVLLISFRILQAQWVQIGADIDGDNDSYTGYTLSISDDGSIIVEGAPGPYNTDFYSGYVRIYQNTNGIWSQLGSTLIGEEPGTNFGYSVSLNSDGSIVAIGNPTANFYYYGGAVSIYENIDDSWTQVGDYIYGEEITDYSGHSVSLSSDGSIVAIGAPLNDHNGHNAGSVRIHQNIDGNWIQKGEDIYGEAATDNSGLSISLSSDGSIIAISGDGNDENGANAGHVRVFRNEGENWIQIGEDIDGDNENDYFGWSLSLNSDGSKLAIGTATYDEIVNNAGLVRVYENINDEWIQIGSDINGKEEDDRLGYSVSINSDGSRVAIGAPGLLNNDTNPGHVRIYQNIDGTWTQMAEDIEGERLGDFFGACVRINSEGSIVAAGAPRNYEINMNKEGQIRMFEDLTLEISNYSDLGISIYPNPTKGIFNLEFTNINISKVNIYNITGREVFNKQFSNSNTKVEINLSSFINGIYIVKIQSNDKVFTSKILKE